MIYGIGVDTAAIARLEKSMARPSFVQRVFGAEEQAMLAGRGAHAAASAAANFAAKEAFGKALGTGIFTAFSLPEVQVLRGENGAPYFAFSGRAETLLRRRRLTAHLSLTHESGLATAFVILEQKNEEEKP